MNIFFAFLLKYRNFLVNLTTVCAFIALPYWVFNGKLFIGGDDTRLIYSYPWEYFKALSFFSWVNLSSVGTFSPNQFSFPFALTWTILFSIFKSRVVIDYLSFSLPLIMGFIYLQKLLKEILTDASYGEMYTSSLLYVLSPIMITNQLMVFLMSAWLIGLAPFITWAFVKFVKTYNFVYIFISMLVSIFLSLGFFGLPWVFGIIIPLCVGFSVAIFFYPKKFIFFYIKKTIIFFGLLISSQLFWLFPFAATIFIKGGNSFADLFKVANTFRATVLQTSTGNITYPLLNLPNRQLTIDYTWPLRDIFLQYYDKVFIFGTVFIIIIFLGIRYIQMYRNEGQRKIYYLFFISFLVSLFLFTVNIGPLKDVFLWLGNLPGFFMFRNAYDKFAPGYMFLYTIIFGLSLNAIRGKNPKLYIKLLIVSLGVIFIFLIPIKQIVNGPAWTTKTTQKVITFPQEYFDFLLQVKNITDPTGNILNMPLNIGGYAIIKDATTNNVFAGTSPTKFFTGINDFSGYLSFSPTESDKMWNYINSKDYGALREFYYEYNVNAIMVTKNIPSEMKHSYLFFNGSLLKNQDDALISEITDKKILVSTKDNYELYSVKKPNIAFHMKQGYFQKISPIKYRVYMHVSSQEKLTFLESFHFGWNLFLEKYHEPLCNNSPIRISEGVKECKPADSLFDIDELSYGFGHAIFSKSHAQTSTYKNTWIIDLDFIKKNYNTSYYRQNSDGSIDILLTVYFFPQVYFFIGCLVSVVMLLISVSITLLYSKKRNK